MKSNTSALILIAAAIFWNNSSVLAGTRGDAAAIGVAGLCITGILLLVVAWNALSETVRRKAAVKAREIIGRIKSRNHPEEPAALPSPDSNRPQ